VAETSRCGGCLPSDALGDPYPVATFGRDQAVALFRRYLADHPELVEAARRELAGKDLACWCRPGELCHADIWARGRKREGRPMSRLSHLSVDGGFN
jgi:hypothetical protein